MRQPCLSAAFPLQQGYSNTNLKHVGLVLVRGRMNANYSVFLIQNLEHTIFVQSIGLYSRQNVNSKLLEKWKWKLKIALAAVSDPETHCLCIVGMGTGPGIHCTDPTKTHGEGITVQGPHIGGRWSRMRTTALQHTARPTSSIFPHLLVLQVVKDLLHKLRLC